MRPFSILAIAGVCALSALLSAVWVAASVSGSDGSLLRDAERVLSADALTTRKLLSAACERDVSVERLARELSAGGASTDGRRVEEALERGLGGKVSLYSSRAQKVSSLGRGPQRSAETLRAALAGRVIEDEASPTVLDACRQQQGERALWLVRSRGVHSLLEEAGLSPSAFVFVRASAGDASSDELALKTVQGSTLLLRDQRGHAWPPWLVPALICAALSSLLGGLLAAVFLRRAPVEETVLSTLEHAAERVAQGDLSSTIQLRVGGRADQTFRSFDRMTAELRETRAKLAEAERAAAWQDIARRVAHEIKNPLSPIKMGLETLRKAHQKRLAAFDEIFDESTHAMLEEVQRIEHIVREFSDFARLPKARPGALDLAELAKEVASLYAPADVALRVSAAAPTALHADREQISQVIVNLLQNAIDAARGSAAPGTTAQIELSVTCERGEAVLRVDDSGPGVAEADRSRIFEPYVTGKTHGTGLGLSIVRRIAQDHGGSVRALTSPLGGARFELRLPQSASMP